MMESTKGLRLVEKTVEVLNLLSDFEKLTIAQLADHTGEPRSSLYRLLRRLEQLELVEQSAERGNFQLGTHLLRWGSAAQSRLNIRKRALPIMEDIQAQTGLTIYLVVRRSWRGVCVERLEGTRVASLVLKLGGQLPLHTGAAQRSLMAFEPEQFWRDYTEHNELSKMTADTLSTPQKLYETLTREREQGFCISDGHVIEGIGSVGAPIFDHENKVCAALSASGMREEVLGEKSYDKVRSLIVNGAASISYAMGNTSLSSPKSPLN